MRFFQHRWMIVLLPALYYWGLPYLLLILGVLPARLLGLRGLDDFSFVPTGGGFFANLGVFINQVSNIFLAWLPDLSGWLGSGALLGATFVGFLWLYLQAVKPDWPAAQSLICDSRLELLYDIAHWAFYRAICWLVFGDLYLGVLGGMIIILLKKLALFQLAGPSALWRQQQLFQFGFGLVTSGVFLFAPNLWLATLLYLLLVGLTESMFKIAGNLKSVSPQGG
jgi:hypothetical protein